MDKLLKVNNDHNPSQTTNPHPAEDSPKKSEGDKSTVYSRTRNSQEMIDMLFGGSAEKSSLTKTKKEFEPKEFEADDYVTNPVMLQAMP